MTHKHHNHAPQSKRRLLAPAILLALLPAVVWTLVLTRSRHNTTALPAQPTDTAEQLAEEVVMQPRHQSGAAPSAVTGPTPEQPTTLMSLLPKPRKAGAYSLSGHPQAWPAETMYEKINGEDIVYQDAGCSGLATVTMANDSGAETIDIFLFQMNDAQAAINVFEGQKPQADTSEPFREIDLGDRAYSYYDSLYVASGRYYLKLIVAGQAQAVKDEAIRLARQCVDSLPDGPLPVAAEDSP